MAEETTEVPWEEQAINLQQDYMNTFGRFEWDCYKYSEREHLQEKVGYALFGPPEELPYTVVERIAEAVLKNDIFTFCLFLSLLDLASLQAKAKDYIKDEFLRNFTGDLLDHVANYENDICNCVFNGDKTGFLKYLDCPESTWYNLINELQVSLEKQVVDLLDADKSKQSCYSARQTEIIRKVYKTILSPDKEKFLFYLPESTWISCRYAARQLLMKSVGRKVCNSVFHRRIFGYSDAQKKDIETVCDAILDGDKDKFLSLRPDFEWFLYQADLVRLYEEKIGHFLFGPPGKLQVKKENRTGYTTEQNENIQKVCNAIYCLDKHGQNSNAETYMSVIFVCLKLQTDGQSHVLPVPVFRIPCNTEGSAYFIDSRGHFYRSWEDFLRTIELPQCKFCYPREGVYQSNDDGCVLVDFGVTPDNSLLSFIAHMLRSNTPIISVISPESLFFLILFLPVLYIWFGNYYASELMNALPRWKASMRPSTALTTITKFLEIGHTVFQERNLTQLQIFQFRSIMLFFTHSAINLKIAGTIITQTDVLEKYQDNFCSNRHSKMFQNIWKNTQQDRAKAIRKLKRIEHKDDVWRIW